MNSSTYLTEEDAKLGRKVCIACGCCLLNAKSLDRHVSYMSTKADHEARRMSALAAIQHNTFCLECRDDFKSTQGLIGHVLQLHSSDAHRLLAPFLLDQLPLFASSISPDHVPDYPPSSRSAASTSTEDSAAVTSSASSSSSEPPKMRTCSICLAPCKPASFARHMNSHESPDKFRCGHPGCSFSTHRTDSMRNHEKQHNALGLSPILISSFQSQALGWVKVNARGFGWRCVVRLSRLADQVIAGIQLMLTVAI